MGGGSSNDRRRPKAALFLLACGVAGVLPHGLGPLGRLLPALGLAGFIVRIWRAWKTVVSVMSDGGWSG